MNILVKIEDLAGIRRQYGGLFPVYLSPTGSDPVTHALCVSKPSDERKAEIYSIQAKAEIDEGSTKEALKKWNLKRVKHPKISLELRKELNLSVSQKMAEAGGKTSTFKKSVKG